MSAQAPLTDDATAIDPVNFGNTFISYYTYGSAIALALDLTLRDKFKEVTLDTLMLQVWKSHGKTEQPYILEDLRAALSLITNDPKFAGDFFASFIAGSALPDYAALLESAGLLLRKANEGDASPGQVTLEFEGKAAMIKHNTTIDSPLYNAGLDRGDQILMIDRLHRESQAQWDEAMDRCAPGDVATIRYLQRGIERSVEITFEEDQQLEVVSYESTDKKVNHVQLAFRKSWLGEETAP